MFFHTAEFGHPGMTLCGSQGDPGQVARVALGGYSGVL